MAKLIERITLLHSSEDGYEAETVYKGKGKKNKRTRLGKQAETLRRRRLTSRAVYNAEMLRLHNESNADDPYGSVLDLRENTRKAVRKAVRKARKIR
jgi:hypothetical protein